MNRRKDSLTFSLTPIFLPPAGFCIHFLKLDLSSALNSCSADFEHPSVHIMPIFKNSTPATPETARRLARLHCKIPEGAHPTFVSRRVNSFQGQPVDTLCRWSGYCRYHPCHDERCPTPQPSRPYPPCASPQSTARRPPLTDISPSHTPRPRTGLTPNPVLPPHRGCASPTTPRAPAPSSALQRHLAHRPPPPQLHQPPLRNRVYTDTAAGRRAVRAATQETHMASRTSWPRAPNPQRPRPGLGRIFFFHARAPGRPGRRSGKGYRSSLMTLKPF
ncbi:hypothetical protein B0H11DRAFT_1192760 [Mycena galericulata]|nr:hypothetical protein B0H11DRAFT_1192760 [Mycena galericulata]